MARRDIRRYSLDEINALRAKGKAKKTPKDAPAIELGEAFWRRARIVESARSRKTSVHLRLDPDTIEHFRSGGPGHLTRMARVLKAYAETQSKR